MKHINTRMQEKEDGETMTEKTEHLNMIQGVITRMANNSLQIKCWAIAVTTAFIALSGDWVTFIALIPIVLFCVLDARYLSLEKGYRGLYNDVKARDESAIDYSMENDDYRPGLMETTKTWSILPFYAVLIVTVIIVGIVRVM